MAVCRRVVRWYRARFASPVPTSSTEGIRHVATRSFSTARAGATCPAAFRGPSSLHGHLRGVHGRPEARTVWAGLSDVYQRRSRDSASAPVERLRREVSTRSSLDQMMYVDLRLWLPDDLLLVGDKMSMAESVEMRVPFLDRQLVDFAESLPSSYKIRHGQRKAVEKAALGPLLPREIVHRKERGFVTPIDRWLRTDMQASARTLLLAPEAHSGCLFRRSAIEQLLRRHGAGECDHTRQLFSLLRSALGPKVPGWLKQGHFIIDEQRSSVTGSPATTAPVVKFGVGTGCSTQVRHQHAGIRPRTGRAQRSERPSLPATGDRERMRRRCLASTRREIGVDFDDYLSALRKVPRRRSAPRRSLRVPVPGAATGATAPRRRLTV